MTEKHIGIHILKMSYRIFSVNEVKKDRFKKQASSPKFSLNLHSTGGSQKPRTTISNIYMNDVISARDRLDL